MSERFKPLGHAVVNTETGDITQKTKSYDHAEDVARVLNDTDPQRDGSPCMACAENGVESLAVESLAVECEIGCHNCDDTGCYQCVDAV